MQELKGSFLVAEGKTAVQQPRTYLISCGTKWLTQMVYFNSPDKRTGQTEDDFG